MNDPQFQGEALRLWKKLTPKAKARFKDHLRAMTSEAVETPTGHTNTSPNGRANDG